MYGHPALTPSQPARCALTHVRIASQNAGLAAIFAGDVRFCGYFVIGSDDRQLAAGLLAGASRSALPHHVQVKSGVESHSGTNA